MVGVIDYIYRRELPAKGIDYPIQFFGSDFTPIRTPALAPVD